MSRQPYSSISFNTALAVIALASVRAAHGQGAGDSDAAVLEEVVVTAERREVSPPGRLPAPPRRCSTLLRWPLEDVRSVIDIQQVAPSVAISTCNSLDVHQHPWRRHRAVRTHVESRRGVLHRAECSFPHEQFIAQSFFDSRFGRSLARAAGARFTGQNSTGGATYRAHAGAAIRWFSGYVDQGRPWPTSTGTARRRPSYVPLAGGYAGCAFVRHLRQTRQLTRNIGPSPSESGQWAGSSRTRGGRYAPTEGNHARSSRCEHFDRRTDHNAIKNRSDQVTSGRVH